MSWTFISAVYSLIVSLILTDYIHVNKAQKKKLKEAYETNRNLRLLIRNQSERGYVTLEAPDLEEVAAPKIPCRVVDAGVEFAAPTSTELEWPDYIEAVQRAPSRPANILPPRVPARVTHHPLPASLQASAEASSRDQRKSHPV